MLNIDDVLIIVAPAGGEPEHVFTVQPSPV